jgi:hypothetical protein
MTPASTAMPMPILRMMILPQEEMSRTLPWQAGGQGGRQDSNAEREA